VRGWSRSGRSVGALLAALLTGLVGACGSSDDAVESSDTTAYELRPTVNLVVNDWTASALNVAIAEQLIEAHLGYPVVPTRMDDTTEIYDGLADGSVDAILEIWPSAMTERDRRFFEAGMVSDIGALGSVGKVGWWVPSYVVEDDPSLATWEGYTSNQVAGRFASDETGTKGRFLGTSEDYVQHDAEIIRELGLNFEVTFSQSEAGTLAVLEEQVAAEEPVLLYWWTPTAAVTEFELVNVDLPDSSDACVASSTSGPPACHYPEDQLFKAASPELATKAPEVLAFLTAFSLTTDDQLQLLADVEYGDTSIDTAASGWIAANEDRWRPWLDAAITARADADAEPDADEEE
jgi:glycine betaine/proline transport system substrate-binding protein